MPATAVVVIRYDGRSDDAKRNAGCDLAATAGLVDNCAFGGDLVERFEGGQLSIGGRCEDRAANKS